MIQEVDETSMKPPLLGVNRVFRLALPHIGPTLPQVRAGDDTRNASNVVYLLSTK